MLERILVPTDFSEPAALALRHGTEMAREHGAALELMTAIHVPEVWLADGAMPLPEDYLSSACDRAAHDLELLAQVPRAEGVQTTCRVLSERAEDAICAVAAESGADLIAMGTQGRTGIAHAVMGSVTERVLRQAPCPVLTIRGDGCEPRRIRTILAAVDFSTEARFALDWATSLAEDEGADLVLAHAVSLPFGVGAQEVAMPDPAQSGAEAAARESLESLREELGDLVSELIVDSGPADGIIVAAANRMKADLIVTGTRGRTGLGHVILGSTAERVVRTAPVPVVVVKLP